MRNLHKPNRYNVASIQAQQTLGGDVMQWDENGKYVEWRDYKWLLDEVERLNSMRIGRNNNISPSFIEDLGNGVEKHDLLFRHPAKDGKPQQ